jgi:predicted dienelactone hydrolase
MILALLASVSLLACQPIQAPVQAEQTAPQGLRPDAPPYGVHGPFAVGYKPLVMDEGTDHPLEGHIWYPALNPAGEREKVTYTIVDNPHGIYGRALLNADIDGAAGPYPLVVFSHGLGDSPVRWSPLVEHYASYGFIVLAPQHTEQFDFEWSDRWRASIVRLRDVKQTLDYAEALTAPGGELAGLIDMEHVAVVGHSIGGYTALAMAGAQYDLAAFQNRCAQLPPADPRSSFCTALVPKAADMAALAGLDPQPEGLWPSFGDPRITAIVPMAGDAYVFDQAGLANVTVPMLALGGTADSFSPYEWGAKLSYDYAASAQKALVTFVGAEHLIFITPCENDPERMGWEPAVYTFVCLDPVWDKHRALDLIHHFSTAFLLDTLKGDQAAHAVLLPEAVNFPGIEYTTTMQ